MLGIATKISSIPSAQDLYWPTAEVSEEAQEELERRFFNSIRLSNGTYKSTYSRRLDDLNDLVAGLLPADRPLEIMDVAVSSGVVTLEWTHSLSRSGIEHRMTAGDQVINASLVSLGGGARVLLDAKGYALQYDVAGVVVPNFPRARRYRLLYPAVLYAKALLWLRAVCGENSGARERRGIISGRNCKPVSLISPRLQKHPELQTIEDDILLNTSLTNCFHVVRAANILNKDYFNDETLTKMVNNLIGRLRAGGLLIVCRTDRGGLNHATVFTLDEYRRLGVAARIGKGSEVEEIVLRGKPTAVGLISDNAEKAAGAAFATQLSGGEV